MANCSLTPGSSAYTSEGWSACRNKPAGFSARFAQAWRCSSAPDIDDSRFGPEIECGGLGSDEPNSSTVSLNGESLGQDQQMKRSDRYQDVKLPVSVVFSEKQCRTAVLIC